MEEWVEVKAPTVALAIEAALEELGIESADEATVEVLEEPEKGFLGIGRKDAVVRVKPRPKRRRRPRKRSKRPDREPTTQKKPAAERRPTKNAGTSNRKPKKQPAKEKEQQVVEPDENVRAEQAAVVEEFLTGLLGAFGLEGEVAVRVEDDIIYATVDGSQTEALIGPHGSILEAIHELTKTVVQRRTKQGARIRLDIAGYTERRREALKIYAERLAQQVKEDQTEIMLEPMNAAERKVVHDAVAEIEGVRTYSEGEEPRRSVVIAPE